MTKKTIIDRVLTNAADLRDALDAAATVADLRDVYLYMSAEGQEEIENFVLEEETLTDNSVVHNLYLI